MICHSSPILQHMNELSKQLEEQSISPIPIVAFYKADHAFGLFFSPIPISLI
jgi:hypothetical protein